MFVILLDYIVSTKILEKHLSEHRAYLDEGYKKNIFIVSGPQNPRIGGVILSQLKDRQALDTVLQKDPFFIHQVATYTVIEFNPTKWHQDFVGFLK
ncbi:MAG: hypothetical protein A3D92_24720 [Bacteroidetes bacterium RIFCSPHIGHO2_02_FULL_44_7]|nr:MAG: hypothetical protein A3D92_24720 [Bacteroidetes bacterium RIFCSPHIGHO2_02_FULL_44_7]